MEPNSKDHQEEEVEKQISCLFNKYFLELEYTPVPNGFLDVMVLFKHRNEWNYGKWNVRYTDGFFNSLEVEFGARNLGKIVLEQLNLALKDVPNSEFMKIFNTMMSLVKQTSLEELPKNVYLANLEAFAELAWIHDMLYNTKPPLPSFAVPLTEIPKRVIVVCFKTCDTEDSCRNLLDNLSFDVKERLLCSVFSIPKERAKDMTLEFRHISLSLEQIFEKCIPKTCQPLERSIIKIQCMLSQIKPLSCSYKNEDGDKNGNGERKKRRRRRSKWRER